MNKCEISVGEYYHIYNRGIDKKNIFNNESDFARFLLSILCLQSPLTINNIGRLTSEFVQHPMLNKLDIDIDEIISNRMVELVGFSLMPNHFHLILKEEKEGGISKYMQRVQNSYTKYSNIKNKRKGYLLEGKFNRVHVKDNEQLLYLSAYVHRNPRELKGWRGKEHEFPWSSFIDYVGDNRWGKLIAPEIILDQFSNKREYRNFVDENPSKLSDDELFLCSTSDVEQSESDRNL